MSIEQNTPNVSQGPQNNPTNNKISRFSQVGVTKKVGLTIIGVFVCLSGVSVLAGEDLVEQAQYQLERQALVVQELEKELSDAKVILFKRENMLATAKLAKLEDQKFGMLTPADFAEAERLKLKIQTLEVGESKK